MSTIRLLSALVLICCQVSCAVVQAPMKMAGGMLNAVGRTLHLSSENTRKPEDSRVESRDLKEELVINSPQKSQPEAEGPLLALR